MLETLSLIPLIAYVLSTPTVVDTTVYESDGFLVNTESNVVLDVSYVHQIEDVKDTENEWTGKDACGPASLNMVINHQDKNYDLSTVINILPSNVFVKGMGFYDLKAGPKEFGLVSNEIEINTTQIYNTLAEGYPVVMNIQNYEGRIGHAIVVVGIKNYDGENAEALIAHDPIKAPYKTFKYISQTMLQQEEGWLNPIGTIKPFYVTKYTLADSLIVE